MVQPILSSQRSRLTSQSNHLFRHLEPHLLGTPLRIPHQHPRRGTDLVGSHPRSFVMFMWS